MRVLHLKEDVPWQEQDFGGKRLQKSVCVSRYGGFGDMLQLSSILPGLKEQGYMVTVNTTPKGFDIIRHDPNIDAVFLQKDGQVLNQELGFYWTKLMECFDKFIMLSESVEGSLIALPGRREAGWHADFRRMIMGTVDYLEATHAIAEVPMPPRVRFYPSNTEKKTAQKFRARLGGDTFVIMWALAGSSTHKTWPYLDVIVARLMESYNNVKVVTCGDTICQVLEVGWENEPRVIQKSGKWSIRETLSFVEHCDLIIGPETGLLNAASMVDMPKFLMLSHSSKMNIGKNWVNTTVFEPKMTPCYPCHILHNGFEFCDRDEVTGTAMCAANTDLEEVWSAMIAEIGEINEHVIPEPMRQVS